MTERKTVKINMDNYNKLMDLKELNGYKSLNETLDNILPSGSVHNTEFTCEPPAFEITDNMVSWNDLKKSKVNTSWKSNDDAECAVVIFKDHYGTLVRFQFGDTFSVNYFHFLFKLNVLGRNIQNKLFLMKSSSNLNRFSGT